MDKIPVRIMNTINKYINELEKNKVHIHRAVLFGSHVTGLSTEWSDIDIALVSDVFEGIRMRDRNKIRKITMAISSDLSPLPFRPKDFTRENPFVREILETGINII